MSSSNSAASDGRPASNSAPRSRRAQTAVTFDEAQRALIEKVIGLAPDAALPLTVKAISERRASAEAREGLSAFLEKRRPSWAAEAKAETETPKEKA